MRTLFILLKNNFINTIGINKILKKKPKKLLLYSFLILLFILYIISISSVYSSVVANYLMKYHMIGFLITMFFIMASFITFFFTMYKSKAGLFNANDNDMLLSMPIKTNDILASRLISMILWNLITVIFILGPTMVIYATKVNVTFSYYIYAILIVLLLPIIPSIIAGLLGYFTAYLTSKSNKKSWFEIAMYLLFTFTIFYISSNAQGIMSFIVKDPKAMENILKWGFYPVYLVNNIFTNNDSLSLLLFVIINVGLAVLFVLILGKSFKNIVSKLQENRTKSNYVMQRLKTKSINKALFVKDVKRYLSSPIYVLNTSIGMIMILGISIASLFYDKAKILAAINIPIKNAPSFEIVTLLVVLMVFLSNTACASISIEGNNFWIMKTLPIKVQNMFNSKLLLNILIVVPAMLISIVILKISFALTILQMLVVMLLAVLSVLVSSQFGLLMNLKFPKMDAINDVAAVKQSLSVIISTIVPLIIIATAAGVYSQTSFNFNILLLIVMIVFIILIIIERHLLNTWGIKRVKEII